MTTPLILFLLLLIIVLGILYGNGNKKIEGFDTPQVSSSFEIGEGASQYYGWPYKPIPEPEPAEKVKHVKPIRHRCPKCEHVYLDNNVCNIVIDDRHRCRHCDITKNKNIDKYVLKSSIPPCPDMSRFATKNMVHSCPDISKYVLKSKIRACPHVDMNNYVLKSEIPACPKLPKCPICPICPRKGSEGHYDIALHPHIDRYILKEHCKRFKKSWMHSLEDWLASVFGRRPKNGKIRPAMEVAGRGPIGYGFGDDYGFGINNPGYGLSGNIVNGVSSGSLPGHDI